MDVILDVAIVPEGAGGVIVSPRGDYVSSGRKSYPEGTVVALTAFASIPGAYFDHWEGDVTGIAISTTITMDSDKAITLVFIIPEEVPTYQLTTDVVGNGTVAPSSGVYSEKDVIILVATPDEGNLFSYWSGDIQGTAFVPGKLNEIQVPMDWDRHIVAHFVEEAAPPPPPPPPSSSIEIKAPESAQEGETVNVSAVITNNSPNPELYHTEIWAGADLVGGFLDTIAAGSSKTYPSSFTMPAYDTTIAVWVDVYYNGEWQYNNSGSKAVALYIPPPAEPEFAGRITRKELDYDAVRVPFPA